MNRAQRRASARESQRPARQRPRFGGLIAINRSEPLEPEEAARLSNEVRMAWQRMLDGNANVPDFDNLAHALNLTKVIADGFGQPAIDVAARAQGAMRQVRNRYARLGRFGVDAGALRDVPPALDFHDEILRTHSPNQLVKALDESARQLAEYAARTRDKTTTPEE